MAGLKLEPDPEDLDSMCIVPSTWRLVGGWCLHESGEDSGSSVVYCLCPPHQPAPPGAGAGGRPGASPPSPAAACSLTGSGKAQMSVVTKVVLPCSIYRITAYSAVSPSPLPRSAPPSRVAPAVLPSAEPRPGIFPLSSQST